MNFIKTVFYRLVFLVAFFGAMISMRSMAYTSFNLNIGYSERGYGWATPYYLGGGQMTPYSIYGGSMGIPCNRQAVAMPSMPMMPQIPIMQTAYATNSRCGQNNCWNPCFNQMFNNNNYFAGGNYNYAPRYAGTNVNGSIGYNNGNVGLNIGANYSH